MPTAMLHRQNWHRVQIVPPWFKDVLHSTIFAQIDHAHHIIRTFSAISVVPPSDRGVLAEFAMGSNQDRIAARFGVSRHHVCRRLKRLRKMLGDRLPCGLRMPSATASLIADFVEHGGPRVPNVRTVVKRLEELSRNELGVLFALLRRQPVNETLVALGIGNTRYHQIKARLSVSFFLSPTRLQKFQLCTCMHNQDLVLFSPCTEKRTFLDTFSIVNRRNIHSAAIFLQFCIWIGGQRRYRSNRDVNVEQGMPQSRAPSRTEISPARTRRAASGKPGGRTLLGLPKRTPRAFAASMPCRWRVRMASRSDCAQ